MSLCAQNMAIGVRAGTVYVLGSASNVEMTNVNRFHENRYLGGMSWFIQQAFPYIIFSLKVMAFLRYFPIIDMFPVGHVLLI